MSLQIALAMVLVTGTGLMIRSLTRVENMDLGYQPNGLLFLHLDAPSVGTLRSFMTKCSDVSRRYRECKAQRRSMHNSAIIFPMT